jgi:hypothetical protein
MNSYVILSLRLSRVSASLDAASVIHDGLAANATVFAAPTPSLSTLMSLIQGATAATQAVKARTGSVATRSMCLHQLGSALNTERAYVQSVVDAAPPDQAGHLAGLAGMHLSAPRRAHKPLLGLALGEQPGTVVAKANATTLREGRAKHAAAYFNWRSSVDGGKTFVTSSTPLATATFTGLPSLTICSVEVCLTDPAGTTAWSPPVTIVTH